MGSIQLVGLAIGVTCAVIFVRSRTTTAVSPHDARLFKERYRARGLKVVALRRVGTELRPGLGLNRGAPIRKYEIEVEGPDGGRETRVRGVSRGDFLKDDIWRYDGEGRRERLH